MSPPPHSSDESSAPTRRRLLQSAVAVGAAGIAGCLADYEGVPESPPSLDTGVRVTDAHVEAVREQFRRARVERDDAFDATENATLAEMPTWAAEAQSVAYVRRRARRLPPWPTVELYRSALRALVNETAFVRAWRGALTRSAVRERVGEIDVPGYGDVPTDRGSLESALVNAAYAEYRLHEAREHAEYAREAAEKIPAERVEDAESERFAGQVAVTLRNAAMADAAAEDVRRLGTALPERSDHADAFRRAAERLVPSSVEMADFDGQAVTWSGVLGHGTPSRDPRNLAHLAEWERERSADAVATLHATWARCLDRAAPGIREAAHGREGAPSPSEISEAGESAHAAIYSLLDGASPVERSLAYLTASSLREARAFVATHRGDAFPPDSDDRRRAWIRFRAAELVAEAAEPTAGQLGDVLRA